MVAKNKSADELLKLENELKQKIQAFKLIEDSLKQASIQLVMNSKKKATEEVEKAQVEASEKVKEAITKLKRQNRFIIKR